MKNLIVLECVHIYEYVLCAVMQDTGSCFLSLSVTYARSQASTTSLSSLTVELRQLTST